MSNIWETVTPKDDPVPTGPDETKHKFTWHFDEPVKRMREKNGGVIVESIERVSATVIKTDRKSRAFIEAYCRRWGSIGAVDSYTTYWVRDPLEPADAMEMQYDIDDSDLVPSEVANAYAWTKGMFPEAKWETA